MCVYCIPTDVSAEACPGQPNARLLRNITERANGETENNKKKRKEREGAAAEAELVELPRNY